MTDVIDAGVIDTDPSDARTTPYALTAVWQTPTDTVTGHIALGPDQQPTFAGHFMDSTTLGSGFTSRGEFDILLMRLSPTGVPLLWEHFGSGASEFVSSLSVGPSNELVIAGGVIGANANLGGDTYDEAGTATTGFLARYESTLVHEWSLFFDSDVKNSRVLGISADGPVLTCGRYAGQLPNTDGGTIDLDGLAGLAAFYAKYKGDGSFSGMGQIAFSGQGQETCEIALNDNLGSAYVYSGNEQTRRVCVSDGKPGI